MRRVVKWFAFAAAAVLLACCNVRAVEREAPQSLRGCALMLVDKSIYPQLKGPLEGYIEHIRDSRGVVVKPVVKDFYGMKPSAIRALLKQQYKDSSIPVVGAIMVGPVPHALRGKKGGIAIPSSLYYEDFDAKWLDEDGDGVFEKMVTDPATNPTEIWTAWWVPPANDRTMQVRMLKTYLRKLDEYYRGRLFGRDGMIFIAGNGNSVEITESWTVLLKGALEGAGQRVTRVYSRDGEMAEAVRPESGSEFAGSVLMDALTNNKWQHVHILTHGSPQGFYWRRDGKRFVAVDLKHLDFSRFHRTGAVIITTSGCSNGNFRGRLTGKPDYSLSIGNRLVFSPNTLTVAFFGSASPQSSGVFAMYYTELIESLSPKLNSYMAAGYFKVRNADYSWGTHHYIFRNSDEKFLLGDPFARYQRVAQSAGNKTTP